VTLKFRVNDGLPGCGRAVVRLQIRKRIRVIKTIVLGTKPANALLTYKYSAKLKKGTSTYRILSTDIAGNRAAKMVSARLRIRWPNALVRRERAPGLSRPGARLRTRALLR